MVCRHPSSVSVMCQSLDASSGGSPRASASLVAAMAISVRTSNTMRSMLRRIARSPRGAQRAGRLDKTVRVTPAMSSISASTSARCPPYQLAPLLHQTQLQHLGLDLDVISVGLRAVIVDVRAAGIAGRQRGSGRAGSLAAGSRLRLRACRCRSECNRGAAPVSKCWRVFWIAVERQAW